MPRGIEDYINSIVIVNGKDNVLPDLRHKIELGKEVFNKVLMAGKRKNESDSAWRNLRTLICGGGGQSRFYREFFTGISNRSNAFNLRTEELESPHNLKAPGLLPTITTEYPLPMGLRKARNAVSSGQKVLRILDIDDVM